MLNKKGELTFKNTVWKTQKFRIPKKFSFQLISNDEVKKIMKYLKGNKSVGGGGG